MPFIDHFSFSVSSPARDFITRSVENLLNPDNIKCGKPEVKEGEKKIKALIKSDAVQEVLREIQL